MRGGVTRASLLERRRAFKRTPAHSAGVPRIDAAGRARGGGVAPITDSSDSVILLV